MAKYMTQEEFLRTLGEYIVQRSKGAGSTSTVAALFEAEGRVVTHTVNDLSFVEEAAQNAWDRYRNRMSARAPSEAGVLEATMLDPGDKGSSRLGIAVVEFEGGRYGVKTELLRNGTCTKVRLPDDRYIVPVGGAWTETVPPKPQAGWQLAT